MMEAKIASTARLRHTLLYTFVFLLVYDHWGTLAIAGGFTIPRFAGLLYAGFAVLNINTMYSLNKDNKKMVFLLLSLWAWLVSISALSYFLYGYTPTAHFTFFQLIVLFVLITNEIRIYPEVKNRILLSIILGVSSAYVLVANGIGIHAGKEEEAVESFEAVKRLWFMGMNPNQFGTLVVFAFLSTLAIVFSAGIATKLRYGLLALIPCQLILVGYSGSAGAYLLAFSGLLIFFLLRRNITVKSLTYIMLLPLLSVLMYVFLSQFTYISEKIALFFQAGSATGRAELWASALKIAADHPFLGLGHYGARNLMYLASGINESPQNVYLEYLITGGPIALTLFLCFLWAVFRKCRNYFRETGDPSSIVFLFVILMYFLKAGNAHDKYVWLLLACIVGARAYRNIPTGHSSGMRNRHCRAYENVVRE